MQGPGIAPCSHNALPVVSGSTLPASTCPEFISLVPLLFLLDIGSISGGKWDKARAGATKGGHGAAKEKEKDRKR